MHRIVTTLTALMLPVAPVLAGSHLSEMAAYGEAEFKQCATCHVIEDDDGEKIAGRNAKTGPNLYCVVGRQAGTLEGFRFGDDLQAAGEAGLEWTVEEITAYLQDPRGFLRTYLDDPKARSKMTYKVRKDGDLTPEDVSARFAAFLQEVCPEDGES